MPGPVPAGRRAFMSVEGIERITVMCVDDHPIVRQGLAALLSNDPRMRIVAEISNGQQAIVAFREHRPDVTLMDLRLPDMAGVEAIMAIRSEFPEARIVVMTTDSHDLQVQRAVAAGARGYILKGTAMSEVLDTIRAIHAGELRNGGYPTYPNGVSPAWSRR